MSNSKAVRSKAQSPDLPPGTVYGTVYGLMEVQADGSSKPIKPAASDPVERLVVVVEGLLAYPDKSLIPWTEWTDLRVALAALKGK